MKYLVYNSNEILKPVKCASQRSSFFAIVNTKTTPIIVPNSLLSFLKHIKKSKSKLEIDIDLISNTNKTLPSRVGIATRIAI